jgi:hypothetical protein
MADESMVEETSGGTPLPLRIWLRLPSGISMRPSQEFLPPLDGKYFVGIFLSLLALLAIRMNVAF